MKKLEIGLKPSKANDGKQKAAQGVYLNLLGYLVTFGEIQQLFNKIFSNAFDIMNEIINYYKLFWNMCRSVQNFLFFLYFFYYTLQNFKKFIKNLFTVRIKL